MSDKKEKTITEFDKLKNEYYLERYKFILSEQKRISESKYKHLALFQTLTTTILGAGIYISF